MYFSLFRCFYVFTLLLYSCNLQLVYLPGKRSPSRVSGSPDSAENVIYEAFIFGGKLAGASFTAFLEVSISIEQLEE